MFAHKAIENDIVAKRDSDLENYSNNNADSNAFSLTTKMKEEAHQICSLLPHFGFYFVYEKLFKTRCAENRVELVLWDILPQNRPKVKWSPKNKSTAAVNGFSRCSIDMQGKRNFTLVSDERKANGALPSKNNAFVSNAANNTTSQKGNLLDNYLRYLKYMKQNKWMKLSGRGQHYNCHTRNNIRHTFLTTGSAKPKQNISQPVNKNRVQGVLDVDEDGYIDAGIVDDTVDTGTHVQLSDTASGGSAMTRAELQDVQQMALSSETEYLDSVSFDINMLFSDWESDEDLHESSSLCDDDLAQASKVNHYTVQDKKVQEVQRNIDQGNQKEVDADIDYRYTYLAGIFPKADPVYLRKIVQRMPDDPDALQDFIQTQWESPTYLTKNERKERTAITQQQKQYTVAFNVKQFLEIFPDPLKHFEKPGRKCKKNPDAIAFLKSHFSLFKTKTIEQLYQKHNYNLWFTAQELEHTFPDRELVRNECSWKHYLSNDIPLLQEIAFIKHRKEILEYLDKSMKEEAKEFEKLKKRNELLECQCCYNNDCMPSKCSSCGDGHVFCNSCIIEGTEMKLAQGVTRIACFVNCDYDFSLPTLQKILTPTQFSALIRKKQEVEVMAAGLDGIVPCPFCPFASIPPPNDKVFKCFNPECMKESCRLCKELNHVPLKCNEKSENARLFLEEKMTEAYLRKCYACSRPYVKTSGCNKITCVCGALMCYLCDKPIKDYEHFDKGKCPSFSNDDQMNETTVQAVAKKTVEFIQAKDPKIKIDTKKYIKNPHPLVPATFNNDPAVLNRVNKVAEFSTYKFS